jgi:hypothetical protein
MAANGQAIAGLVIEPLAAGTDLVITVGVYAIAAVANCLTNATRDSLTFTVLTGGASDGIATISSAQICSATNDAGTALTAPFASSTSGSNLVVPVGANLTLDVDQDDLIEITGPLAATSLDLDGSSVALTQGSNANGKITLDNTTSLDQQARIQALSVGAAKVVVATDGTPTTPTSLRTNTVNITIVASCVTDTYSAGDTSVEVGTDTDTTPDTGEDVLTYAAGDSAYISVKALNAYGTALPSGAWAITATNGALVNLNTTTATLKATDGKGTSSFATASAAGATGDPLVANVFFRVNAPSGSAVSTVVTISYKGQTVASPTINFRGEATKINVIATSVGKNGGGQGQIHYTLTDAAGNLTAGNVTGLVTSFGAQITSTTDSTFTGTTTRPTPATAGKPATFTSVAPVSLAINSVADIRGLIPSATYGILLFNCGSASGKGTITIRHYQPVTGAYISTPVELTCAGGIATYTVSADKATYKVGEVATFTITAKDSSGNPVHDYLSTNNAAIGTGTAADVSFGGGTITKATATSDPIGVFASQASGTAVYKAQLTTAGSFNAVVNLAGSTTKSITVPYTITSSDVSNTEVLAAIVKLIASINKQIAALQKSLRR